MTNDEDDVAEIENAEREASEILHCAVLQFLAMDKDRNIIFTMLGMELALMRHAARLDQILKDSAGSKGTKATFGNLARAEYADVARYQAKKRKPTKPKGPKLSVVK